MKSQKAWDVGMNTNPCDSQTRTSQLIVEALKKEKSCCINDYFSQFNPCICSVDECFIKRITLMQTNLI